LIPFNGYKAERRSHTDCRGFTLLEVLIAIGLFVVFAYGTYQLYSGAVTSYQANSWKQGMLGRSEVFWTMIRRHLEEASDLKINNIASMDLTNTGQKLLFRSIPKGFTGTRDGNLMSWVKTKHDLASGITLYEMACTLSLQGNSLFFEVKATSGTPPASDVVAKRKILDDVETFVVTSTPVWITEEGGEYMAAAKKNSTDENLGAVLEVSIVMRPPPNIPIKNLFLSQNSKFKINVPAEERTSDFTAY
jgi:prepilin-type N-terminal cleavage/methylation domain-containing protein